MIVVGRHMEGITINPLEYVLDDNGAPREFEDENTAQAFLKANGFTDEDIYWLVFEPVSKPKYLQVGHYTPATDETAALIDREFYGQGYIVKDEHAYATDLEQVCYIPELSDATYTHQSFLDLCDHQESLAVDLFDRVDWQHPESLLEEDYVHGELDDCAACGRMFLSYDAKECPHCHAPYQCDKGR
jgi:hypothetical protein